MFLVWLIGLILALFVIYIVKNSRVIEYRSKERPIFTMLGLIGAIIVALIPIMNISTAVISFAFWCVEVSSGDLTYKNKDDKFFKFIQRLNKPIE